MAEYDEEDDFEWEGILCQDAKRYGFSMLGVLYQVLGQLQPCPIPTGIWDTDKIFAYGTPVVSRIVVAHAALMPLSVEVGTNGIYNTEVKGHCMNK